MQTHSEITHVSRDRGSEYASAASRGAPQAIQVADRFHIGVPTFFPPSIPAKAPVRSRTGLNEAGSPVAWQQRKRYSRPFSLKK